MSLDLEAMTVIYIVFSRFGAPPTQAKYFLYNCHLNVVTINFPSYYPIHSFETSKLYDVFIYWISSLRWIIHLQTFRSHPRRHHQCSKGVRIRNGIEWIKQWYDSTITKLRLNRSKVLNIGHVSVQRTDSINGNSPELPIFIVISNKWGFMVMGHVGSVVNVDFFACC